MAFGELFGACLRQSYAHLHLWEELTSPMCQIYMNQISTIRSVTARIHTPCLTNCTIYASSIFINPIPNANQFGTRCSDDSHLDSGKRT